MKRNKLPTQEEIRKFTSYDPKTGILTWKRVVGISNKHAGKPVGTPSTNEYLACLFRGVRHRVHRIVWVLHHGDISPIYEIDHINGNRTDNRIENLRLATKSQNMANSKGKSRCGLPKGVEKNKARFTARIMVNGKRAVLGTYDTPEQAHAIYAEAAKRLSGEFARAA